MMYFSSETTKAGRKWHNLFQMLKEKNCRSRILDLAEISFRKEREIKTFLNEEKLREFVPSRPSLKEKLKEFPPQKKDVI